MRTTKVAAVVLAAGESQRLGRPKQLLPFRGRPLLRAVASEACASSCQRVVVVVGANEESVRDSLGGLPVTMASNPGWREGLASSIRCGVAWAEREGCDAVLLLVCDQPELTSSHLDRLVASHAAGGAPIVASSYAGTLGVPALFGRASFAPLLALRGTEGAKRVIRAARRLVAIDWPAGGVDVDTQEDAARLPP